eukprot:1159739-Pelagomonas_calceolata.AAC.6
MGIRRVTGSSTCLILVTRVERSLLKSASQAQGLVSSQCLIYIKWIWRFWMFNSWSCLAGVASYSITFHTAEYPMARSDHDHRCYDSIGAAGVAFSLIRNVGVKKYGGITRLEACSGASWMPPKVCPASQLWWNGNISNTSECLNTSAI